MPRPSIGETAHDRRRTSGAISRRARGWRTGCSHHAARSTGAAGSSGGTTPSPRPWSCRPNMPTGWTRCRTTNRTVRSQRPCGRLSNSISPSSRRSSRHGASAVIEQRDGPYGMGHDDARGGGRRSAGRPPEPRVDAGVKELNEMTIGRTDDPENPISVPAFEAAKMFGAGSRTPSGPAVMVPRQQAGHMIAIDPPVRILIRSCIRGAVHTCTLNNPALHGGCPTAADNGAIRACCYFAPDMILKLFDSFRRHCGNRRPQRHHHDRVPERLERGELSLHQDLACFDRRRPAPVQISRSLSTPVAAPLGGNGSVMPNVFSSARTGSCGNPPLVMSHW